MNTFLLSNVRKTIAFFAISALFFSTLSFSAPAHAAVDDTVENPELGRSCGLDIALLADVSESVSNGEFTQLKNALAGFATALDGTPTIFSFSSFGTVGSVEDNFALSPLDAASAITGFSRDGDGTQYTNWDDGLANANSTFSDSDERDDAPNLLVIATDGNPNKSGNPAVPALGEDEPGSLAAAVTRANSIKGDGTRIIALGIGDAPNTANLEAISSVDAVYSAGDFEALADEFADLVEELCGGTITVNKVIDEDGDLETEDDQTLGVGWEFNVAGSPQTTDEFGQTLAVEVDSGSYSVTEVIQGDHTLVGAFCSVGDGSTGTLDGDTVYSIEVGNSDVVTCTFYNSPVPEVQETCEDGIQNQDETGIDEGGVCEEDNQDPEDLSCSFASNDENVSEGQDFTLSWETDNADTVSIDQGIGDVDPDGSTETSVDDDTTFTLSASRTVGENETESIECHVDIEVGSGGGGGSSSGSKKRSSSSDDGEGEVLGEATEILPIGAPETGAGGTSPFVPVLPSLFAILEKRAILKK